jgi:pathogenesis-related protein 1
MARRKTFVLWVMVPKHLYRSPERVLAQSAPSVSVGRTREWSRGSLRALRRLTLRAASTRLEPMLDRVACFALAAVVMAAGSGVPAAHRGMLAEHNRLRAAHCAPPLAWSADLAKAAQRSANRLAAAGCRLEHSRGRYGENLAAATAGALTDEQVAGMMWYGERERYDFARPGFRLDTGHFTQLVWVGSARLGCAKASCRGIDLWVCNYDPPGNVQGEYRSNVLPSSCQRRQRGGK